MTPPALAQNDQIRIISPSGNIDPIYIDQTRHLLQSWGFHVTEGKFARGAYGRYGGTCEERIIDLQDAINDPAVKAILCSRGGYGVAQIIDKIDFSPLIKNPKWLIGFSDITVIHNALTLLGVASVHGIMTKHIAESSPESEPLQILKQILDGQKPVYQVPAHSLNKAGTAQGILMGGNLSVLMGLHGSKFELPYQGGILFIEDIGEKPYQIDRMLQNLRLSGVLENINGLIVGQFNEYDEDPLMIMELMEIIAAHVSPYKYPVCFNFPAGHVDHNLSLLLGVTAELTINSEGAQLRYL